MIAPTPPPERWASAHTVNGALGGRSGSYEEGAAMVAGASESRSVGSNAFAPLIHDLLGILPLPGRGPF